MVNRAADRTVRDGVDALKPAENVVGVVDSLPEIAALLGDLFYGFPPLVVVRSPVVIEL
jgi:hypothetical protein